MNDQQIIILKGIKPEHHEELFKRLPEEIKAHLRPLDNDVALSMAKNGAEITVISTSPDKITRFHLNNEQTK